MNNGLVILERFFDAPTAHMARGYLETNDIPCFIFDDKHVQTVWFLNHAVGVRLMVHVNDLEEARKLLDDLRKNSEGEEFYATYAQSARLTDRTVSILVSFIIGIPFLAPLGKKKK